jgi:hypothetical protein
VPAEAALPSLLWPSAMTWWMVLPLRALITSLICASVALDWTLPRRDLMSLAAEWIDGYWYPSCLREQGVRRRPNTSFVVLIN